VQLLTNGTRDNPILGFCLSVIAQHEANWPPEEDVLAQEFIDWFGFNSFLTRDRMKELCQAKGVNLSFVSLSEDVRGLNFSYQNIKEIILSQRETAPFGDSHTLFHEFRELIEHQLVELKYATVGPPRFARGTSRNLRNVLQD
jgi:hypothetical protein